MTFWKILKLTFSQNSLFYFIDPGPGYSNSKECGSLRITPPSLTVLFKLTAIFKVVTQAIFCVTYP
jgi:hypothetical protein